MICEKDTLMQIKIPVRVPNENKNTLTCWIKSKLIQTQIFHTTSLFLSTVPASCKNVKWISEDKESANNSARKLVLSRQPGTGSTELTGGLCTTVMQKILLKEVTLGVISNH